MRSWRAIPVPVLAAVLAACGGGDRLTRAEYLEQADAICAEANAELAALGEPSSLEELATFAPKATEIAGRQLDRLRDLHPPAEDEEALDRALDLTVQQNELAGQIGVAAAEGDGARVNELAGQIAAIDAEANRIALEYGLEVCGNDE